MIIPMRPTQGERLTPENVITVVNSYKRNGYIIQPKLNGDRGILESTKSGLKLWNRYGGIYSATLVDLSEWRNLHVGTILDGEIYKEIKMKYKFYPFEAVVDGSAQMRINIARQYAKAWLFSPPSDEWLLEQAKSNENIRTRRWE